MLVFEEGDGILWVKPIFASTNEECEEESVVVTIDDCECDRCDIVRGIIDPLATILLQIPVKNRHIVQRLTPQEAKAIGNALITYATDILGDEEE